MGLVRTNKYAYNFFSKGKTASLREEPAAQHTELEAQRTELEAQRIKVQQLMQSNQALSHELAKVGDLKTQLAALQATLGNLANVTIPVPASTSTMTSLAANSIKKEGIKEEPVQERGMSSRRAQRSKPEYISLDD